jgi:hypothetical protein
MGRVRAVLRLCELYTDICLTTEEKSRKKLSFLPVEHYNVLNSPRPCIEIIIYSNKTNNGYKCIKVLWNYIKHSISLTCFTFNLYFSTYFKPCIFKTRYFTFVHWFTNFCNILIYSSFLKSPPSGWQKECPKHLGVQLCL